MKIEIAVIVLFALMVFSGCTKEIHYDCSKCNVTQDCSQCETDCSECGPVVNATSMTIESAFTLIVPTTCDDATCGISDLKGWAKDIGLEVSVYNASWAQAPILLMYTEDEAAVIKTSTKLDFMKDVCGFVNSTEACSIADEELAKVKGNVESCLEKYNVDLGTVFFYHANWCPHCQKMMPWVNNTQKQGYEFLWVESEDAEKMKIASECMVGILEIPGGVPQFGCPANGELHIGEFMTEDDMLKFASDCVAAAK